MIDAKERHSKSFEPTVVKSKWVDANCVMTTASCDEIVGTCAGTFAIFVTTGVMPVEGELDDSNHPHLLIPSRRMNWLNFVMTIPSTTSARQERAGLSLVSVCPFS
jgi:hypothetical protein